jgi:hypothetical protein
MRVFTIVALGLICNIALAERGELQLQLAPTVSVVRSADLHSVGPGGLFLASYGLRDWLSINGEALCERFTRLTEASTDNGRLSYNSTRCSFGPAVSSHLGVRNITTIRLGASYRFDVQDGRELGNISGVFIQGMDTSIKNALVLNASLGFERRFYGPFTAGIYGRVAMPVLGGMQSELNFTAALVLGANLFL